ELWKSDGTKAGTQLVKDIYAGSASSSPSNLTNVNGTLFFQANDGTHGQELWKSDGTADGTTLVKDVYPGGFFGYYGGCYPHSANPSNLTNVNGTFFFRANEGVHGADLWKSDGTAGGTTLVKDIFPGFTGAYAGGLTNFNGTLFFSANDGTTGS